jgi:hypothetical protein
MPTWMAVAVAGAALAACGGSPPPAPASRPAAWVPGVRAVRVGCDSRSEADFPGAFTRSANLVVGPLVLIGGAWTDPGTVRSFGGNKFPLLVESGHTVTVEVEQPGRRLAGLAYGPLPQGRQTRLRDTYRRVTFVACRAGMPPPDYRADGPASSTADGRPVTFWAGGVVSRAPTCVPLSVSVDGERSPRRVGVPLGRRCGR